MPTTPWSEIKHKHPRLEAEPHGGFVAPSDPGEPRIGTPRVSVTTTESALLAGFACGKKVLEIGTGLGVSTRDMAETAELVVTVDIDEWVWENIWPSLPSNVARLRDTDWIVGYTTGLSGELKFDMVFIDGDHAAESVMADLRTAVAHGAEGSIIVCHDAKSGNVRTGLDTVAPGQWSLVDTVHGLGLINREELEAAIDKYDQEADAPA